MNIKRMQRVTLILLTAGTTMPAHLLTAGALMPGQQPSRMQALSGTLSSWSNAYITSMRTSGVTLLSNPLDVVWRRPREHSVLLGTAALTVGGLAAWGFYNQRNARLERERQENLARALTLGAQDSNKRTLIANINRFNDLINQDQDNQVRTDALNRMDAKVRYIFDNLEYVTDPVMRDELILRCNLFNNAANQRYGIVSAQATRQRPALDMSIDQLEALRSDREQELEMVQRHNNVVHQFYRDLIDRESSLHRNVNIMYSSLQKSLGKALNTQLEVGTSAAASSSQQRSASGSFDSLPARSNDALLALCDLSLVEQDQDIQRFKSDPQYRHQTVQRLREAAANNDAAFLEIFRANNGEMNEEAARLLADYHTNKRLADAIEALMLVEDAPTQPVDIGHPTICRGRVSYTADEYKMIRIGRMVHHVLIVPDENKNQYEASLLQYVAGNDDLRRGHAYLQKYFIACLVWYWDYLAALRGDQFTEGIYQLEYENDAVYKYLSSLQYEIAPEGLNGAEVNQGSNRGVIYKPVAQLRSMFIQHFKQLAPEQFEIDFSRDNVKLPYGHTKLLFGALGEGKNRFFVKPRTHASLHAAARLVVSDSAANNRKEHVPSAIRKAYIELLQRTLVDDSEKGSRISTLTRQLDMQGMQYIHRLINEGTITDQGFIRLFNAQPRDNMDIRFGREVIHRFTGGPTGGAYNAQRVPAQAVVLADEQRAYVWKELIGVDVATKAIGSKIVIPQASATVGELAAPVVRQAADAAWNGLAYAGQAVMTGAAQAAALARPSQAAMSEPVAPSVPVNPDDLQPAAQPVAQPAQQGLFAAARAWLGW